MVPLQFYTTVTLEVSGITGVKLEKCHDEQELTFQILATDLIYHILLQLSDDSDDL